MLRLVLLRFPLLEQKTERKNPGRKHNFFSNCTQDYNYNRLKYLQSVMDKIHKLNHLQ